jgi:GTPase SAR1 family protein
MLDTPGATAMLTTVKLNKQAFVFLVFDVSDRSSFENLSEFIENFNNNNHNDNRLLYIIGNKTDKGTRQVSKDDAEEFAATYGLSYFEVSVKENKGVDAVFKKAIELICKNLD